MGPWYGEWCILTATSWNTGKRDEETENFDEILQVKWWFSKDSRLGVRQSFRRPSVRVFHFSFSPLMSRIATVVDCDPL